MAAFGAGALTTRSLFSRAQWANPEMRSSPGTPVAANANKKIAIVGAGLAGLSAAWTLQKRGLNSEIFEATGRIGGRVLSETGTFTPNGSTELGGEFFDSSHEDALNLCREFGLELWDKTQAGENDLEEAFFFNGRFVSQDEIVRSLTPFAKIIKAHSTQVQEAIKNGDRGGISKFDEQNLSAYIKKLGLKGWLKEFIETAYLTEFGAELKDQSSLNFILLVDTEFHNNHMQTFGESDERFKIKGGNQRLAEALKDRLTSEIHLNYALQKVEQDPATNEYILNFQTGSTVEKVRCNCVLITIPFSVLRRLDIQVPLRAPLQKLIQELGYGENAKIILGFDRPFWRDRKQSGNAFSDAGFQSSWDSSRQNSSPNSASLTLYYGGSKSYEAGHGELLSQTREALERVGKMWPESKSLFNKQVRRSYWPGAPFTLGSYAYFRPGQWLLSLDAGSAPEGQIHFAGEHLSTAFQGFMNGALETGRLRAEDIAKAILGA